MGPSFRRGLVERVRVKPKVMIERAAELWEAEPVVHEWVSADSFPIVKASDVAALPQLGLLDTLFLSENRLGAKGLCA